MMDKKINCGVEDDGKESYSVADMSLAAKGKSRMDWAWRHMPVMRLIAEREGEGGKHPLYGRTIACCHHLEAKTACLLKVLQDLGAVVAAAGSNPFSTQDDICAALADYGVHIYSKHGMTPEEYNENLHKMLAWEPDIVIDDGADTVAMIHEHYMGLAPGIIGGCVETTSGVKRLKAMEESGVLKFPMLAVNDALSKHLFDNRYGAGQSIWDAIMRTTNCLIAGKNVVVAGFGWCGKGVAARAAGLGAYVAIVEANPHNALEAFMEGYHVMDMAQASEWGDIFVTVTGNSKVIRCEHFLQMKDGALLCNGGHFDAEICVPHIKEAAAKTYESRTNIQTYEMSDGRKLHLLANGRMVNIAAGDGHPIEIMDMSFSTQLLCILYIAGGAGLRRGLQSVPESLDQTVANYKLESLGLKLERLTSEQENYMRDWR